MEDSKGDLSSAGGDDTRSSVVEVEGDCMLPLLPSEALVPVDIGERYLPKAELASSAENEFLQTSFIINTCAMHACTDARSRPQVICYFRNLGGRKERRKAPFPLSFLPPTTVSSCNIDTHHSS